MSNQRTDFPPNNESYLPSEGTVLITVAQVAMILGVSPRTVWRLCSAGKMLAPVRIGGAVRWRRDKVLEWIRRNCPPVEEQ